MEDFVDVCCAAGALDGAAVGYVDTAVADGCLACFRRRSRGNVAQSRTSGATLVTLPPLACYLGRPVQQR